MECPIKRVQRPAWRLWRHAQSRPVFPPRQCFSTQPLSPTQASIPVTHHTTTHSQIRRTKDVGLRTFKHEARAGSGLKEGHSRPEPNRPSFTSSEESLLAAQKSASTILEHESILPQAEILAALDTIEQAGSYLVNSNNLERPRPTTEVGNATSALFTLAARHASRLTSKTNPESAEVRRTIDALSNLAYEIAVHPPVFLSAQVLAKYVGLQILLLRPSTFPEIFDWYAHKPSPSEPNKCGDGVVYNLPDPKAIAAAVDPKVANRALDAAIDVRDLPLALNIIETTFRAPSYRRAKIFTKAMPPIVGAALAPVAAWTLASQLAETQTGLAPDVFQQVAFAGMLTYMGCVGTIGYVALTTANDQMQRVTWATGMPLRTRWLREEERAALDSVALAWGFREKSKWGEEEGEEWEELKEWIGLRGMVLDKVGLMEGME